MAVKIVDWAKLDAPLVKAYQEDKMPIMEIGRKFTLAASTVARRLKDLGVWEKSESNTPWSEQDIDILKEEWERGTVASLIAPLINKSRNAVLGKAHRLELSPRAPSNGRPPKQEKRPRIGKQAAKRPMAVYKNPKAVAPKFYENHPLTTKPPISIMELGDTTCRAPVGRGSDGLVTYCGDMVFPGQVWCPGHCAIYFVPPKERRRYR